MTADAAADLAAIEDRGYVVIERAVGPDVLDASRAELAPYLDGGRESYRGRNDFEGFATNRVYGLLAKAPSEATLVTHPRVLAILDAMLRPGYLLSANLAINLLPGETAQDVHFDDTFYPVPRPRAAIGVSAIWAIDDFTAENGATEIIPGSHRWGRETPAEDDERIISVEMPAGSVVVFAGTLWHRGGANRSDRPRLAITPQYCEPWARQQENMMAVVGSAASSMPPVLQSLIGYSIYPQSGGTAVLGHV
ncbi:MAG TPA: phytanoyl-CoA dioxygenase family protein, partial [Ilumatobacteraceae bacterium]|nr:phytanoyl-CoA dioxygenase family protein [Ilumatobacteraceae bacterium]